ncbi:FAD binding domain-containing protein [Clostridium sp. SHJSY1]|uniref:FAD binding domain-containing protein n=1 Tax=Clostridium sp. SHJSY1 TaxID=2942483 RepID=UPI002876ED69|nr:FAD binding domain-containing protein [Clostridium sp. SHJSY1]MDS0524609.1 FAD binding domain-containing protein [Clostridium sp. SHJSY1]
MVEGYYPNTLLEALKILEEKDIIIHAGGTDLMVRNKNITSLLPKFDKDLLYIGDLKELKEIKICDSMIEIGAACTYSKLLKEKEIPNVLKEAIKEIASPAIRNKGTIGGNICNASPAGDTLPILYALDAKLKLTNISISREINIEDFILGPRKITLKKDEILESIIIPKSKINITYYEKVGARKASAISKLSVVALADIENEKINDIRIALGAVGTTVVRRKEIENIIIGTDLKDIKNKIEIIKKAYSEKITPINDQRSTAIYRKTVALKLIEYFLISKLPAIH